MIDNIKQYNKLGSVDRSLIKKALTSATGVGEASTGASCE